MAADKFLSGSSPLARVAAFDHSPSPRLPGAVEQRLASAERDLRIQFTRIAQLQAEVDLLVAAIRRSENAGRR